MSLSHLQSLFTNVWAIFLVVLFFGGSIFVHELGHFLAARRRGVKVTRFSIGFGPKIASWVRDGVEWRISWLPLGGYVALPQLADMSEIEGADPEVDVAKLPPVSYASKMIVFGAGAAFNVVFAFVLATILWVAGLRTWAEYQSTRIGYVTPTVTLPDGTEVPSPASQGTNGGLQPGDRVKTIDGKAVNDWFDLQQTLVASTGRTAEGQPTSTFLVEREGREVLVTMHPRLAGQEETRIVGIVPAEDFVVAEVLPDTLAAAAGFQPGDELLALDGQRLLSSALYAQQVRDHAAEPVVFRVRRGTEQLDLAVPDRSALEKPGDIGLRFTDSRVIVHTPPWELIAETVRSTFRVLVGVIHPKSDLGVANLSGPVGIARVFHATAMVDFRSVLWIAVLVNVNLAIFNLLPIPVLDGGHMVFATLARLRGRPLPPNLVMTTQSVFMVMLLSMIAYVSFFDVRRWARDREDRPPPAKTEPAKQDPAPAATEPPAVSP